MKLKWTCLVVCFVFASLFSAQIGSWEAAAPAATAQQPAITLTNVSGATPLYFIANQGQMSAKALYYAKTPGYTLWLTQEGLVFDRTTTRDKEESARSFSTMVFIGSNKDIEVVAANPADYMVSYFIGRDEADWKTGIATSKAVVYKSIYEGIDLKVYGTEKQIEYDWIVAPGADPELIRFAYTGEDKARLDAEGNLVVGSAAGQIIQRKPVSHQVVDGRKVDVASAFRPLPDGSYGFALGAYNPRHTLTIDPLVLVHSTYLGGHDLDIALRVAVDVKGALYLAGITRSGDFPPEMGTALRNDYFVSKLSADGANLIYTAFFPAKYLAQGNVCGLAVDKKSFVFLCGLTGSSQFPLKNPFQSVCKGYVDAFILKLSRDGRSLLYSSYIGGGGIDYGKSLAIDASGAAYLTGQTSSRDFPRKKAYQSAFRGATDGFVAKVAPDGTRLMYSTYLGGTAYEDLATLAVDAQGGVVVGGLTASRNYPVKSAFQRGNGGKYDGVISKLSPAGNTLVYSSYFGGTANENIFGIALDASGAAYFTGFTDGEIPLKNAFQTKRKGMSEALAAKVAANGRSLVYASYLGGGGYDAGTGIAVDGRGAAYIVGSTMGKGFPVKRPYQPLLRGSQDAFLTIIDPGGAVLLLSTFLGGRYQERAYGLVLGTGGEILISGTTNSPDFPGVEKGFQNTLTGYYDTFVVQFEQSDGGRSK